ncbi:hypothetical protein LCGC14_1427130 [marine sediment metagenome]|uniref:Uncharacterized protein n=1 Tax=marine sediment metagenome TaxID=412755 RepID=A0A0F9JQ50_9ZZZZ
MAAADITDTLLAATDFVAIREVSTNINDARILPYVREAQRIDMLNFLGEDLYYDFLVDQTAKTDGPVQSIRTYGMVQPIQADPIPYIITVWN